MLNEPTQAVPEHREEATSPSKISWKDWNPGLDNGHKTLGDVYDTLPGNDPEAINFIVRLFENPKSPIAFKGAIDLERHDYIHVLLGRGLLPQDEAFVIGYTMGTAHHISDLEAGLFKLISKKLYPHPYKFRPSDMVAYTLGLEYGKRSPTPRVYEQPIETMCQKPLAEVRQWLGICPEALRKLYAAEQVLIPDSNESKRLPV